VGGAQSLEKFAAASENVIVCKSMSKVYALSGARAAYLCAGPHQLEELRAITPPWVVGLPTQLAAVRALQDREYYEDRYAATGRLREELARDLRKLGWEVNDGVANFVLCQLPESGPTARDVVERARELNLFIRNASSMGDRFGDRAIRIAVKDRETNRRMVEVLRLVSNKPA
jgi:histidinol-phosphate/aromatic aminotransferase/cobyric acid decarboxylase-like protein